MDFPLPSRAALKAQARRLRATLTDSGTPCSHAQALEAVAHQWGARDWNTLSARAPDRPQASFTPGQRVTERYLGHRFASEVRSARIMPNGRHALTLRFQKPIDVVASQHFSSLRQQVECVVDAKGRSAQTTSDGQPHVVIDDTPTST